jgi:hypothetical protein
MPARATSCLSLARAGAPRTGFSPRHAGLNRSLPARAHRAPPRDNLFLEIYEKRVVIMKFFTGSVSLSVSLALLVTLSVDSQLLQGLPRFPGFHSAKKP